MKYVFLTFISLLAFAGNSILCRLALASGEIDASSFTAIRLITGSVVLLILACFLNTPSEPQEKNTSWLPAIYLFLYAVGFSFAYVSLETGTGALILFASVQIAMITFGVFSGSKLLYIEWIGIILAFIGFTYLVLPGVSTPSLTGFILMTLSGIAWAAYTLSGKGASNPLADTSRNFLRTIPFVMVLFVFTFSQTNVSFEGIMYAALSGALASGLGYTVWYMALKGITSTQAAVVQLFVPVIAAIAGVIFADEQVTLRLVISSILILGGVCIVVLGKHYHQKNRFTRI